MKKRSIVIFIIVILNFIISGCGIDDVPDENALREMFVAKYPECLQRYIYKDETFNIDSFKIVRRQTNEEAKTDDVDCKITVHNEFYEGVLNYRLHLNFYDEGGWQLDDYEKMQDEEMKAKKNTLPDDKKEVEIDSYADYYGHMTFVEELFNVETGVVTRKYNVNNSFAFLEVSGDVTVEYELAESPQFDGYFWAPHYKDNVVQTWNLSSDYKFAANPQNYSWEQDFNDQVAKVFGADGDGEDIAKGIAYIKVKNVTDEEIAISATIINRDYDGGFSFDSFYQKDITFDIKGHVYSQRVFSNRDGDYMNLVLDPEKGFYVEKYLYDDDKTRQYYYISY